MVDAAVESGDDGSAVLGDDEGAAFGQLADLFGAQDRDVVAGEAAAVALAALPAASADAGGAEQVGDLLVERDVLGPAEQDEDVGEPEQRAGFLLAEDGGELPPGLGGWSAMTFSDTGLVFPYAASCALSQFRCFS